jgi:hypothetical protein
MNEDRYYDLIDDMETPGRWVLGDIQGKVPWVDPWQFTAGKPANVDPPLTIEVLLKGRILDYSITPHGVPVVTQRGADLLASVCGSQTQLIEVSVQGYPGPFFIANAVNHVVCVDEQRSQGVQRFSAEDGLPDRIGDYHAMDKLMIDPARTGGLDFFRITHYHVALIVSERLKRAMEDEKLLGPRFEPVT